ncbi:MAG: hypothetical protein DWQ07_18940 [Chloroflexi bacterium]|nr:MAG: hypothetical protein DWQ07_18940 [Chloroflexota bacterium]MBL1195010.1 hypothetical protein [Chloroflexota bacterium]NOH12299.1 hypothetical protein [Chloroflexota bacterium]
MNKMLRDEGKLIQTNTVAGGLIGAALGAVIGLLAGWSTTSVYDDNLAIIVGSLLVFTVALGFIGAILGIFLDQDQHDRNAYAHVGVIVEQQAIPAPDWPRQATLLVDHASMPADRVEP